MENIEVFPATVKDITPYQAFIAMTITSEVDAGYVSDRRQEVKGRIKEVESMRKRFTEPLLESKRRIDEQAKTIISPLEAIVKVLDTKLIAWHQSQEQIRLDEERKRREEELAKLEREKQVQLQTVMISGDEKAAEAIVEIDLHAERLEAKPLEIARNTKTDKSTTYLTGNWTFEIVDANLIPREFMAIDEIKLGKFARAMKETANVPGVRFFKQATIGGK